MQRTELRHLKSLSNSHVWKKSSTNLIAYKINEISRQRFGRSHMVLHYLGFKPLPWNFFLNHCHLIILREIGILTTSSSIHGKGINSTLRELRILFSCKQIFVFYQERARLIRKVRAKCGELVEMNEILKSLPFSLDGPDLEAIFFTENEIDTVGVWKVWVCHFSCWTT